jgi:hypothetical protein
VRGCAPVPVQEVTVLKAILVGLLAVVLVTQATAATTKAGPTRAPATPHARHRAETLERRLDRKLAALHRYRGTIRFFHSHRSLLSSSDRSDAAVSALAYAEHRARELSGTIAAIRKAIASGEARRLAARSPRAAICDVFGSYCDEAVAVARCESRLNTTAQNGQYLGLFQMGATERRLFGHGTTARAQALAAHRYFMNSGRNWSPWSCRWAAV